MGGLGEGCSTCVRVETPGRRVHVARWKMRSRGSSIRWARTKGSSRARRRVSAATFGGRVWKAAEVAASIPVEARKVVQLGEQRQWYFTKTIRIPNIEHPARLVILWDRKNGAEPVKRLLTNKTFWEITRILRVSRTRWTGTETFHWDGTQPPSGWVTVSCAAARARSGISPSSSSRTVCSSPRCASLQEVDKYGILTNKEIVLSTHLGGSSDDDVDDGHTQ